MSRMKMVPIGATKQVFMRRASVWLSLSVVYLLFLFGTALFAIPAQAQTFAYVANDNSVSVINTSNNTVVSTVGDVAWPSGVAITPTRSRVYVTNFCSSSVSV